MEKPAKFLVEFIADFVREPNLRCAVLRAEKTAMLRYGLTGDQLLLLRRLDKTEIVGAMYEELQTWCGLNLDVIKNEVIHGDAVHAAYSEGRIHIRGVDGVAPTVGADHELTVRGQGFDIRPEVVFKHDDGEQVEADVINTECGVDLYQRVKVKVKLTKAGAWTVGARNVECEAWNFLDNKQVTAT
jgi:hypothetical protein